MSRRNYRACERFSPKPYRRPCLSVAHYRKNRVVAKSTLDGQIGVVIWIIVRDRNAGALSDRSSEPLEKKRLEMPYQRSVLSLDEARKAMDRMLQEAFKAPDRPVAIAICDDQGELVTFARMDKCAPLPLIIARKKAFTAARTRADTKVFAERLKSMGRSVSDLGEPNLLPVQGGVAIIAADGSPLGGIGVSGLAAEEDEAIARIGLGVIVPQ
jgi:glc operon protein GlcG